MELSSNDKFCILFLGINFIGILILIVSAMVAELKQK
jgi:hypothetical protein